MSDIERRNAFVEWYHDFQAAHEDIHLADRDALLFEAFKAGELCEAAKQDVGEWVACSDRMPTYEDADESGQVWYSWDSNSVIIPSWQTVRDYGKGKWMQRVKNNRPQPPRAQS